MNPPPLRSDSSPALFEISWEVCNKLGGIHTVVATKARLLQARLGQDYVIVGPWLLGSEDSRRNFEPSPGFEAFEESCRRIGVPVRVGRWRVPGAPRTLLVEFSGLFARKDALLGALWEHFGVDSITGGWEYDEPVIFGHAAGMVIERWYQEFQAPHRALAVAQFHEWSTGAGLLYLRQRLPLVGTVFTTHATVLGRELASRGRPPLERERAPEALAEELGVRSKHSLEKACALQADVFTTVSALTADEGEVYFGRRAQPLLPNGIDVQVIDELARGIPRAEARAALVAFASRFLGEDVSDAAFLLLSGRYEFHNKGIDLLLQTLAQLRARPGRRAVLLLTVPTGQTGLCRSVRERLAADAADAHTPLGISTHNLIEREHDPIQRETARLGLDNAPGARVKVIQVPIYLNEADGLLNLPYEAVLAGVDLSVFPSFYEPWGYTPQESLAVGVPTVTTDLSGFGQWALAKGLGLEHGVLVLARAGASDAEALARLEALIESFLAERAGDPALAEICRRTAQRTSWADLIVPYEQAHARALQAAHERADAGALPVLRPQTSLPVAPTLEGRRPRLFPFDVSATLPARLRDLERLARNYSWSWDPEGPALFEDISPTAWNACGHNPVQLLRVAYPEDLQARAQDGEYCARLARVLERFERYMAPAPATSARADADASRTLSAAHPVAYFCAEFGLHESLCIYSGGLGVLAGDHLKSASDIRLPLVGVGLFYRHGYLRQRTSPGGDQIELETLNDPRSLPLALVRDARGEPLEISLQLPSSTLWLRAWSVAVGRVTLYLLDADLDKNRAEDRAITAQLYGGDGEQRLRQEIVLGRGGVRLLMELRIDPAVYHINEGHAAFLAIERVGALVRDQALTFDEARELVRATTVFTTHTPVPAGHDRFGEDLMRRYFSDAPGWMGVSWERFLALGHSESARDAFNMTYLALHFAGFANGVSRLHGEVSKELLHPFWPGLLRAELPIAAVTNGVHLPSWVRPELGRLLAGGERPVDARDFAAHAADLDPAQLWAERLDARRRLLEVVRRNLRRGAFERHDSPTVLARMLDGLDEHALLIGFARRFAPYKRAGLIFRDLERLRALLDDPERPVRIFFAGKAHPRDDLGKQVLRSIVEMTRKSELQGRVFFLDDYDVDLARALVQGVDVWLNNPVRTLEASGTSGMKAAANGVLNLSVPDGWWVEGYDGTNGWSIGEGRTYGDPALQDELDSGTLLRLLQEEVLPLFFERDSDGLPRRWLERARRSLASVPTFFNTDRMVAQYRDAAYVPMAADGFALRADGAAGLKRIAAEHARLRRGFAGIVIAGAQVSALSEAKVGDPIQARMEVRLGSLEPRDVEAELVFGHTLGAADLRNVHVVRLQAREPGGGEVTVFEGTHRLERSGSFAYGLRVRARATDREHQELRDLVLWA